MPNTILEMKGIDSYYGNICALRDISLHVNEGEIVTPIGSNGAGKSTTLRTISGLLHPRKGKLSLMAWTFTPLPSQKIANMGMAYVPEGRRIFPKLTVQENLEMSAYRIRDKNTIRTNLTRVLTLFPRLEERLKQKGGTLSGGEQQMLAMGRAMMSNPTLLLLDEPSMGLAPIFVQTIFSAIQMLNKEGISILLIEQNATKALQIADRGYVIQTGSIMMEGIGEDLIRNDTIQKAYLG